MAKPKTTYSPSTADAAATKWLLNSTSLTLSSTLAFLNGYFTAAVPNQLNNKVATTYTGV